VASARWLDDPANKNLTGDALAKALIHQPWDPSVKSLVPFPQVLATLNGQLDWTQQLGYAFANQQADVMDSVQRLRQQAQAGYLKTTEQQRVVVEKSTIVIEPTSPQTVYVPVYSPTVVYGAWPYPAYPPLYFPPQPGYVVGNAFVDGVTFVIDQDGVLFQKDLGKGTAATAAAMTRYDPDLTWARVDVMNN
jgi:hypothetical protein